MGHESTNAEQRALVQGCKGGHGQAFLPRGPGASASPSWGAPGASPPSKWRGGALETQLAKGPLPASLGAPPELSSQACPRAEGQKQTVSGSSLSASSRL